MNGIAVLVTLTALGVDYGWQPAADGQLEYIIQIEPGMLESLKNGAEISSVILPEARNVRRFRIKVGTGPVPRRGNLDGATAPTRLSTSDASRAAGGSIAGVRPPANAAVSPPSDASRGGSLSPPRENRGMSDDFSPDGFLNLPPPPSGPDGKTSVLVRPGNRASLSSDEPSRAPLGPIPSLDRINPPPPPDADAISSEPSGRSESSTAGGGWPLLQNPGSASGLSHARSTSPTDRTSSNNNSSFPVGNSRTGPLPPPPANWSTDTHDQQPSTDDHQSPGGGRSVRPVRSPDTPDGSPAPILGARRSEVLPPAIENPASESPASNWTSEVESDRNAKNSAASKKDLLASVAAQDAAAQKPNLDEQAAGELKEIQRQLEPEKPWSTLVLTSLALFASLATNLYLGWIALGVYRRYRDVVAQLHQFQTSAT